MPPPESGSDCGEGRYRAIVEAQAELISLARFDGSLVCVNGAYGRHFGMAPEAMIGGSLFDHVLEADRPAVRGVLVNVLATGRPASSENRMVGLNGQRRWVAWTNSLQQDDGERLLLSVGHDITERKALKRENLRSEAFVRKITDSLPPCASPTSTATCATVSSTWGTAAVSGVSARRSWVEPATSCWGAPRPSRSRRSSKPCWPDRRSASNTKRRSGTCCTVSTSSSFPMSGPTSRCADSSIPDST